ncbi:phosphatase PAP2 family protein [Pedobacter sp. SL55]|uniref:phosphatase PAP2 family protein n=1 Tax=Pedobacter sp. SL55 TaxID=2995161 RepID=UPI00226DE842|nr:phosphatase PAP2 family protein [Pedobacter sp. SL55]WAC42390.1 phosphatase PAP2 family protein [Pedobacter sp. SL55]
MTSDISSEDPQKNLKKDLPLTLGISAIYLILSYFLVGFKTDQLVLIAIFNALYYLTSTTRKFIIGFSIFIVYWIIYDYMKAFPNYHYNAVHIADLYNFEKSVFGIEQGGKLLTPNEYWLLHTNSFLDVLTGFFYLMWVPVPLAFAAFLFFNNERRNFLNFLLTFVWVNLLGFVVYYLYPAAPPWYVQQHGFEFIAGTPGNTAGLIRFDNFFGIELFKSIYSKGSNVFAAMPSLHSAYPLIVVYYATKGKFRKANVFFITVMVGIWFAAVYTSHHYLADVLAGITTATIGIISFNWLKERKPLANFIQSMLKLIS